MPDTICKLPTIARHKSMPISQNDLFQLGTQCGTEIHSNIGRWAGCSPYKPHNGKWQLLYNAEPNPKWRERSNIRNTSRTNHFDHQLLLIESKCSRPRQLNKDPLHDFPRIDVKFSDVFTNKDNITNQKSSFLFFISSDIKMCFCQTKNDTKISYLVCDWSTCMRLNKIWLIKN